jgi:hypothetical protein
MSKKPVIVLVNRRALIARIARALIKRGSARTRQDPTEDRSRQDYYHVPDHRSW